jgi:hypothetical protein
VLVDERREFLLAMAAVEELHVTLLVPADAFADRLVCNPCVTGVRAISLQVNLGFCRTDLTIGLADFYKILMAKWILRLFGKECFHG